MKEKIEKIVDGVTIKYHANGITFGQKEKSLTANPKGIGNGIELTEQ